MEQGPGAVFLLWHRAPMEYGPGEAVEDEDDTDDKLIGVFDTEAEAERVMNAVKDQPGFRVWPDRFTIERHTLNRPEWLEGFCRSYSDGSYNDL